MNFVFIKLFEDTDSVILAVNKLLCYANIIHKFEGVYYPNQSVIYPHDFRFLNVDKPSLNIGCKNDDDQSFRMVGYDKNLYGSWLVDSVVYNRLEYEPKFNLKNIQFSKESIVLNDSMRTDYLHSGYDIQVEGYPYKFYKIFVNSKKMILINTYQDSHEVYYFTKVE